MPGPDLSGFSMMSLFKGELETHGKTLVDALGRMAGGDSGISLAEMVRAAHSIKGAARIVMVDPVVKLAGALENALAAAKDGKVTLNSGAVMGLMKGVDLLVRLVDVEEGAMPAWFETESGAMESALAAAEAAMRGRPVESAPKAEAPGSPGGASHSPAAAPAPRAEKKGSDLAGFSLLDLFRTEVESRSVELNDGLVALEGDPSAKKPLEGLMRAAHSVKGAARVVQLDIAVKAAHALEDCFVAAQGEKIVLTSDDLDVLFEGIDLLVQISKVSEGEIKGWLAEREKEIGEYIGRVEAVTRGEAAAKRPAAPAARKARREGVGSATPLPPAAAPPSDQPAPPPSVAPSPPPRRAAPVARAAAVNREVRITSENLNRLMGLAGETLVEARWLDPFAVSLVRLKRAQAELKDVLEKLDARFEEEEEEVAPIGPGEIAEIRQKVADCQAQLADRLVELDTFSRRNANLAGRLYREVIASRMRPFSDGTKGFPRVVRDLAKELGKQVRLELSGTTTDVDRDILEKLDAPLGHIVRNALDHGIETPEERRVAGKPETGLLRLDAQHRAGRLVLEIRDDGRGIDLARLEAKVLDRGLSTPELVSRMSDDEKLEFLFLPGFSTAKEVTQISGRGVGLDVVKSMVQEVGGSIRIRSRLGEGSTFELELPLTRSVVRTLVVEVAEEPFAIPLARIDRALFLDRKEIALAENRQYFTSADGNVGLVSARQLLGFGEPEEKEERLAIVVLSDAHDRYGLVVDRFVGEQDLVVRPIDPRLGKIADVDAVAILPDGSPVLIVDVEDAVRSIDNLLTGGRLHKVAAGEEGEEKRRKRILVVDDSITVREVQRHILENQGYEVEVAVDGMDGWNAVRTGSYDLVISDVDMPRMTGIELVGEMKKDPQLRALPVMIVSYKDREEDRLRGLEAGASYYLTKGSFHDETMINAVVDLIGKATS